MLPRLEEWRLEAATRSFMLAGDYVAATDAATKWGQAATIDPSPYLALSEIFWKQNRLTEMSEAFMEYVHRRTDDAEDWQASVILKLGLEARERRTRDSAVESAALITPFKAAGHALAAWYEPWFDKLSAASRNRWWVGLYAVSSPHIADDLGESRWDEAADAFGEAVAFELKHLLFGPFAAATPNLELDRLPDVWQRALKGYGTLGQMFECLLQCRVPTTAIAKQFQSWLRTDRPSSFDYLQKKSTRSLTELARLRGQAQHSSVNAQETRQVFQEASALLKALTSDA